MESIGGENTEMPTSTRKVVVASFIGTTIYPTGGTLLISIYIAAVCAMSVVCYALAAETYRKDIYEEEPEEWRLVAQQQG